MSDVEMTSSSSSSDSVSEVIEEVAKKVGEVNLPRRKEAGAVAEMGAGLRQ